jgi:leucyl aminopeptidase (aminopeptidase T)
MAVKIGRFFILSEGVRFKASDNKIDLLKRIFRTKRNKRNLGEASVVFFFFP